MQPQILEGKVAVITGAGSSIGMGRAIAEAYARAGARVVLLDVNQDGLDKTAKVVGGAGDSAVLSIVTDVGDPQAVTAAVDQIFATLGGVDILVNNAGVLVNRTLLGGFYSNLAKGTCGKSGWRLLPVSRGGGRDDPSGLGTHHWGHHQSGHHVEQRVRVLRCHQGGSRVVSSYHGGGLGGVRRHR